MNCGPIVKNVKIYHEWKNVPPCCDWHGPEVQVVSDGVLQVVVHSTLREPRVQVLTQV